MIYPYLVFQTLYVIFANQVLEKDADMQYTTPYWLLWYLFAIIVESGASAGAGRQPGQERPSCS